MKSLFSRIGLCLVLPMLLLSCQQKEAPQTPPASPQSSSMPPAALPMMPSQGAPGGMGSGAGSGLQGAAPHENITMPPAENMKTFVPDSVKGKWRGIKLTVVDRQSSSVKDYAASLGGKLRLPQSGIVVEVSDFLPDFKIEGTLYTSSTNQPNNPAVNVLITDGGKQVFKGWLFQKFPTMHPFQHERYGITLKEGVSA